MRKLRKYEFALTPFAGGEVERVSVLAECRAFGFTLAALQASDPNNVWKVRLVSDDGRELDPYDVEEWRVPREYSSSDVKYDERSVPLRAYEVDFELFGGCRSRVGFGVVGRANVFTAAAIYSDTPDAVMDTWITSVGTEMGGDYLCSIRQEEKYGGVMVDLNDSIIIPFRD